MRDFSKSFSENFYWLLDYFQIDISKVVEACKIDSETLDGICKGNRVPTDQVLSSIVNFFNIEIDNYNKMNNIVPPLEKLDEYEILIKDLNTFFFDSSKRIASRNFRKIVQSSGISLRGLSKKSGVGISSLSYFYNVKKVPKVQLLEKISSAINISVSDILSSDDVSSENVTLKQIIRDCPKDKYNFLMNFATELVKSYSLDNGNSNL